MTTIPATTAEAIVPLPAPVLNRPVQRDNSADQTHQGEPVQGQQSKRDTRHDRSDTGAEDHLAQGGHKTTGQAKGRKPVDKKALGDTDQTDPTTAATDVAPAFAEVIRNLVGEQAGPVVDETTTRPQTAMPDRARILAASQGPMVLTRPQTPVMATGAVATGPVATEPVATGPIAAGPIATEPVATGPIAAGPIATEPVATGPVAAAPTALGEAPVPLQVTSGTAGPLAPEALAGAESGSQGVVQGEANVSPPNETQASLQVDPAATGGDQTTLTQMIEGGPAARMSAQPQSVVGAEKRPEAGDNATEAGLAVVQPTRSRLSPQQVQAPKATRPVTTATSEPQTQTQMQTQTANITQNETATAELAGGRPAPLQATTERSKAVATIAATETTAPEASSQTEPTAQTTTPPAAPVRSVAADQVAEQVRQASPQVGQRVVVRLNPPELGHVRLTLRGGRGGIRGVIEAEDARTLAQLRDATPPMIQRLADSGIQLRRLDLVLSGNTGQASPDASNSSLRDGSLGQQAQDRGDQGSQGQTGWSDRPGAEDSTPRPAGSAGPSHVSDDSINVWI